MFMMRGPIGAGRPAGPHADDLHAVAGPECEYWDYCLFFSAWNNNVLLCNSIKSHSSLLESSTY